MNFSTKKTGGRMWHEARKQEKKIRGMLVDYRRRAERRRDYYEKIKSDPTQFLQVHGRPCKIHLDPIIAAAGDSPANMMPWQGNEDNLIDRFDVRAHLDWIPEANNSNDIDIPLTSEDRQINYERYRIIVQNEFLGVTEEKFLHQIHIEEQFGSSKIDYGKEKKKSSNSVAIGYNYETEEPIPEPPKPAEPSPTEEKEDDDSDIDLDICVDVSQIETSQAHEMNVVGQKYGLLSADYFSFLTQDFEEAENMRQARKQEEEKAMYSGRRSRRERRAFREKKMIGRVMSPPSYAARESPEYNPYRKSSSKSRSRSPSPANAGQITYITSFGGEEEPSITSQPVVKRVNSTNQRKRKSVSPSVNKKSSRKVVKSRSRSDSRSRNKSYSRKRDTKRSRSPYSRYGSGRTKKYGRSRSRSRTHWSRSRSSYSRSRSRSRRSKTSRSYSRSRSRSRSRSSRSRSRRPTNSQSRSRRSLTSSISSSRSSRSRSSSRKRERRSCSRSYSRSPSKSKRRSSRSKSRSRSKTTRSKSASRSKTKSRSRSRSKSRSRSRSRSSRSRSRSNSKRSKSMENKPATVPRYYGRRGKSSSLEIELSDEEKNSETVQKPLINTNMNKPKAGLSTNSGGGHKSSKITPQERLKKKMQALLNRQYKADKKAEQARIEKLEQQRQDREDEIREMSLKLRRRQRERRHRYEGGGPSSDSRSSPSRSPSPKERSSRALPPPRSSRRRSSDRSNWDRDRRGHDYRSSRGNSDKDHRGHSNSRRHRTPPRHSSPRSARGLVDY